MSMLVYVDLLDEVLVAADHHHRQQASDQEEVDKPKDIEGKIDDLGEKVSDLADRGELDPALGSQILNELDALETSTDQGAATPP